MHARPPGAAAAGASERYIYIACPWTPVGGGMFKVADYLIQAQSQGVAKGSGFAELRPLDTRGGGRAIFSIVVLASALWKLVRGRAYGGLAGVHVNMAERLSLFRKGIVIVACHVLGLPVVLHLHAAQLHHFYRGLPGPLQAFTRWVFSLPAACIVLGEASQRFVTTALRVPAARVQIVINGVPEPTVSRRQAVAGAVQRILFLGNLSERKGVSDLLHALAEPGFHRSRLQVSIAGGGDIGKYEALSRQLGIDSLVKFEGWTDQARSAQLLADADILVLPSYDEGLPLVILEALANGVAVVCTPVGEIPGVLQDGRNACFVEPGNVPEIAASLRRVLGDPLLRKRLEAGGRKLYEQGFSLRRFFQSVAEVHLRHFGICGQQRESTSAVRGLVPPGLVP